ncbi:ABC transporter substrate-binding protein [Glycomyces amatae]|uniref:ABC transporter substrate-binding protein n=1 Tax=Glycomyces amatae TaxID=2881355 RepID=UPI00272C6669|nr:extracellular solute-binding protein [Glycomyces amatae]
MPLSPIRRRSLLAGATGAAALAAAAACSDDGPAGTADDPIEISFEWWGDEARAELTKEAIALFESKNEGIKVQANFADYAAHWEGLTGRMASRDLPDVFQMDYPRLRQFATSGMLLPLEGVVDTEGFREGLLDGGRLDDQLVAVPVAGNTLGLIYRADLFDAHGVAVPEPGHTWDDYAALLADLQGSLPDGLWAGEDWARSYLFMEMWVRQQGGVFYSDDAAALGFTKEQLVEYWSMTAPLVEQDLVPSGEEMAAFATDPIAEGAVASEIRWDTAVSGFLPTVQEQGGQLGLCAPPTTDPANLGIYLKPSMQLVVSATTERPEACAKFIDFFLGDPGAVAILGTNRGIPAKTAGLDAIEIDEASQLVLDYEAAVADYIQPAPAVPPSAAGAIEAKYQEIYEQVQYAAMTPEEAADLFFTEAETLFASEQ